MPPDEPWLALLGPLPDGVVPRVSPVAPAELPQDQVTAIRGWRNLELELGSGTPNYRIILVLVDEMGELLSASDHVVSRRPGTSGGTEMEQWSIGGRFESDGSFQGTCWHVVGPEPNDEEEPAWAYTPRKPTAGEINAIFALATQVQRLGGPSGG